MTQLIANNAIVLHRNGKPVRVKANMPFEFTADEGKELLKSGAVREPKNEAPAPDKKVTEKLMKLTAKLADAKTDADKAKIKEEVLKFCEDNGLDVPDGFKEEGL